MAIPKVILRVIKIGIAAIPIAISIFQENKARKTPTVVASPLPPWKLKKTGQVCPITDAAPASSTNNWGIPEA